MSKVIQGYENYVVTSCGKVINAKTKRVLKPFCPRDYLMVKLYKDKKHKSITIHRLVAAAFLSNLENKPQVNHINGIKTDNRVENLEWCTASENQIHAYKIGLSYSPNCRGESHGMTTLNESQVKEIFFLKLSSRKIAKIYNISYATANNIKRKYTWGHLWEATK